MTLFTAQINKENLDDKIRICVMSRLTEKDGKTPVARLVKGNGFDYWAKILAPPSYLVGAYYHKEITIIELFNQYCIYLRQKNVMPHVKSLVDMAMHTDVVLLCVEKDALDCHRLILAAECARYEPKLKVEHLQ